MSADIPSLGDSSTTEVRRRVLEKVDLPQGRENIIAQIRAILSRGGVQKLTVELGKPIKVERLVRSAEVLDVVEELVDDDLMNMARNSQIIDMPQPEKLTPHEYLFIGFLVLERKGLKAKAFLIHKKSELKRWLKINAEFTELFGVEVFEHPDIPENSALLIAADPNQPQEIITSYRLTFDVSKVRKNEADSREIPEKRALGQRTSRTNGEVG